jgi:isopentenyl-diphosphate delta-isomerase
MTGGTEKAGKINRILAAAAQETGIPMGVGSQRVALENPQITETFAVRNSAPDILLFANLGAIQLNYELTPDDCQKAVDMIEADALILHLNPLQEAVMDDGNTNFAGLVKKIESVCRSLPVPVIIKEVGWGISRQDAVKLKEAGVAAIDIAGAGGTSWTEVEMHRAKTEMGQKIASAFVNWGIPTSESIGLVKTAAPDLPIFASGGIRNGMEIAKTIALGAVMGGMASPFLKAADQSLDAVVQEINRIKREIQISMFAVGAGDLDQLAQTPLYIYRQTHTYQDHT